MRQEQDKLIDHIQYLPRLMLLQLQLRVTILSACVAKAIWDVSLPDIVHRKCMTGGQLYYPDYTISSTQTHVHISHSSCIAKHS